MMIIAGIEFALAAMLVALVVRLVAAQRQVPVRRVRSQDVQRQRSAARRVARPEGCNGFTEFGPRR